MYAAAFCSYSANISIGELLEIHHIGLNPYHSWLPLPDPVQTKEFGVEGFGF